MLMRLLSRHKYRYKKGKREIYMAMSKEERERGNIKITMGKGDWQDHLRVREAIGNHCPRKHDP